MNWIFFNRFFYFISDVFKKCRVSSKNQTKRQKIIETKGFMETIDQQLMDFFTFGLNRKPDSNQALNHFF